MLSDVRRLIAKLRSGDAFDTDVQRDLEHAEQLRTARDLDALLRELEVIGLTVPDTAPLRRGATGASAIVQQLWPAPHATPSRHNDLGCALAWLHEWDDAIAAFEASRDHGSTFQHLNATHNIDVVTRAKARAKPKAKA